MIPAVRPCSLCFLEENPGWSDAPVSFLSDLDEVRAPPHSQPAFKPCALGRELLHLPPSSASLQPSPAYVLLPNNCSTPSSVLLNQLELECLQLDLQ